MSAIAELSNEELADECRSRELSLSECLAEVERRRSEIGHQEWNEKYILGCLAQKRLDPLWHPTVKQQYPTDLPPAMFRYGYEWATLSLIAVLERVLDKPSEEIREETPMSPVGKGLYRANGKPVIKDYRRMAAIDLLDLLTGFFSRDNKMMFLVLPQRKSRFSAQPVSKGE